MLSLRARRSSLAGLTTSVVLPAQWLLLIFLGDLSITLLPVGDRNDALLLTEQRAASAIFSTAARATALRSSGSRWGG